MLFAVNAFRQTHTEQFQTTTPTICDSLFYQQTIAKAHA